MNTLSNKYQVQAAAALILMVLDEQITTTEEIEETTLADLLAESGIYTPRADQLD